jgi:hypothetical protein
MTALHGLSFFGIGRPASTPTNAWREESDKVVFKNIRLVYPVALYTVSAYRLLLTLGFGSSVEVALSPLGSLVCFAFTAPISLFFYVLLST